MPNKMLYTIPHQLIASGTKPFRPQNGGSAKGVIRVENMEEKESFEQQA
jgi:hypothetical protein